MPAVVMYMPSALPRSTTLVSPPTMATPERRSALDIARTSASRIGDGRPSSSTNVTTMEWPLAPATARSFMVPFTASSPMEPPGKRRGFTTKLSAVMAMGVPSISTRAASPSGSRELLHSSGANSPSTSLRLALPPAPCAISICGSRKRTVGALLSTARYFAQATELISVTSEAVLRYS